jgi:serine/threonine protein kinase/lipopolysaccharide biosynthesis regulator YciM
MSVSPKGDPESLPLSAERRVDETCRRFEGAWKAGPRPRLEDFLGDSGGGERLTLLRELIRLDVSYRRAHVEEPRAEDYLPRFPELDPAWLAELLRAEGTVTHESTDFSKRQPSAEERAGAVLAGRYKLLERIGEGGMGSVWVAQQTEPVKRNVAVKLIKSEGDSRAVLARFEAERQALALMDHPNIAKVLDGGTTASGRPFFVMELVKGVPITKFCDSRKLTPKQRLELFVPVCQAIQHAHQKGIIHRDIKPSNVLIALYDDRPVPKVIDFGVAKATVAPLTDATLHTGFGAVIGTPQYMSPEQATLNNLDIDTRSDIYSLGVLLYELLTGSPPFNRKELEKAGMLEILRVIREEEPPKPSTKVSTADALPNLAANRSLEPAKLSRQLRGEIDWIVMKALDKERARRYETANGLAADIQRYLTDEPVMASPPSAAYRLKKFVKRHRGQVIAAALVLLALLLGMAGTTAGLIRAEKARDAEARRAEGERLAKQEAEKRLEQIEKGVTILAAIFRDLDPTAEEKGGASLRVQLGNRLEEAARQLDGEAIGDAVAVARLQSLLGNSLRELGHFKQAEATLTKARRTLTDSMGADHPDTLTAKNRLGELYRFKGEYPKAEALLKEVVEGRTAKAGPDHPNTLTAKNSLATVYWYQGNYSQAEALYKDVLAGRKVKLGADHIDTLATGNDLAVLYKAQRRYPEAEALLKEVIAVLTDKYGADHIDTLTSKNNLAAVYQQMGKYEQAEELGKEVLVGRTAKLGPNHPATLITVSDLAYVYYSMRKWELSIELYERVYEQQKKASGPENPDTLLVLANMSLAYADGGRLDEGIRRLEEVLAAYHKFPEPRPVLLAYVPGRLGLMYERKKEYAKAEPLFREALQLARGEYGDDDPSTTGWMALLAQNLLTQKKYAEAEPVLRECLPLRKEKQPDEWSTFNSVSMLGEALLGQKKYAEAEPLLKEGYDGMKQRRDKIPAAARKPRLTEALQRLVRLYEATDNKDEAAKWRKELEAADKMP